MRVDAAGVHLTDGRIDADEVLWTTKASPAPWLAGRGLALDPLGFLRVDATLRAIGRDDVFAAGNVAAFDPGRSRARASTRYAPGRCSRPTCGRLQRYCP